MKRFTVSALVLAAVVAAPASICAQDTPTWHCDESCQEAKRSMLYAGRTGEWHAVAMMFVGRGLIVSGAGKHFAYRASWGSIPAKKHYKESQLEKMEKDGVHVIRLRKDASERDVDDAMEKQSRAVGKSSEPIPDLPAQYR